MKFGEQAPGLKYSPEQKERMRYLLEIQKKDLSSPTLVGYHGTGLSVLKILIETGKLPGRSYKGDIADSGIGNKGDLHFYPRAAGFPSDYDQSHLRDGLDVITKEKAIKDASWYAGDLSERDIVIEIMGLDLNNPIHRDIINYFYFTDDKALLEKKIEDMYDDPSYFKEFLLVMKELKLDKSKMMNIISQIKKELSVRKGIIFGFDRQFLDLYKIKSGDDDGDFFINCPEGLDYKLLCGLRPLGEKEREFLANLRGKI